jgi:hypothetical protein
MPRVTFVQDVYDNETGKVLYDAGYTVDVSERTAQVLIRDGHAERVDGSGPKPALLEEEPVEVEEEEEAPQDDDGI